jgi:hypothetical protein
MSLLHAFVENYLPQVSANGVQHNKCSLPASWLATAASPRSVMAAQAATHDKLQRANIQR